MPQHDESARPVCLVTGGARRIGAAVATALAGSFDIALHYRSSRGEAGALATALRGGGARIEPFQADLADPVAAAGLVDDVVARFGRLDMVVNNASAFEFDSPSDFDPAAMQRLLAVNLVAPLVVARRFAELGSPRATLVQMLDSKVLSLNPDFFSYTLAKVALRDSVAMLAMHFRRRMRVCGIAPSVTLVSGDQSPENFERAWRHTLTGAGPTPQDIAATVRFIWDNTALDGEIIALDAGQRHMSLERDVAFVVE